MSRLTLANLGAFLCLVLFFLLLGFALAWLIMQVWNYGVVPAITITRPIDYGTAYALMVFFIFVSSVRNSKS